MTMTMFDEDYESDRESAYRKHSEADKTNSSDENGKEQGQGSQEERRKFPLVTLFMLAGTFVVVSLMGVSVWWLLFSPSPSTNVQEAADIITEDISATMSTAEAFTVSNSSEESVLTVETPDDTCKVFRSLSDGSYQAVESEARLESGQMRFLPVNYHRAYSEDDAHPVFEYHHSEEELQHGVYVGLSIGDSNPHSEAAVNISGDYDANMDTTDESFCFR